MLGAFFFERQKDEGELKAKDGMINTRALPRQQQEEGTSITPRLSWQHDNMSPGNRLPLRAVTLWASFDRGPNWSELFNRDERHFIRLSKNIDCLISKDCEPQIHTGIRNILFFFLIMLDHILAFNIPNVSE